MKRTGNPRVNPGTFSDLFESTAKASLRRGQMARSPRRLPPLEPEPSNSSTSTANLPQEPEQQVDQQNAEIPIPEETNFPNISTYENARAGFALQSDDPPPAEPLPPGPYGTSPQSILPKVQIPFITPPDVTPRSIEVERLKRLYQSMDIAQLLSDRGINYAQEIMFVPNESTFKPIFQLWSFDDDSFDCRTVENYLEIGKDENGKQAGIPCHVFTSNGLKWADAIAWEYNYDKHLWRVTFPNHEQDEEWVPRLRLLFYAEDPRVFADRIANAVNERRRAESWIRFRFYVENMSNKAMPDIPEDAVKAITKMIPSPRIKIELPIEKFMEEAQINYKYAFNVHSFMSQMKNDPLYARTLGLFDLSKEEEPKPKQYQTTSEFQKHREQFAFHSLYTKDCIFTALMKTRASCLDVANTELLVLRSNKSFHLEEFQQTQAQIISKTKRFLTEDWVPQLGRELRAALSNVSKGWFNLEETDREVYNMSKFSNFMVLVSCMMIDAARTCVLNNFQRFDDFIQDLSPNNVDVKTPTEVIGQYNKESTGAMIMPLFEIDMTIENNNEICYGIDPNLFRTACVQIFSSIVDSVRSIPIIEPRVLPDMFRNVNLTLSTINDDEKELVEHRERVVKRINEAIDYLQKYLDTYKQYIEFIQLDTNKYSEQLANDQPTLDDCRNIIKEQQKAIDEIHVNVPKREIVGIFAVNVTTVRAYLIQKHHKLIKIILDYVSKTAKGLFKKFREEYRVIDSKITSPPTKIEELDAQRHYIETVPGLTEKLHARVMDAMRYYDFIDEYYHPISQDDFELKWECFGHSRHCAFLIEKSKAILEGFFIKFEQDLESAQEKFEGDLDKLSREVSEVSKYTDVNNSEQYATEIRRIAKAIEAAEANVKTFNSRQTIFGKEQTDYTRVSDLRRTFDPFSVLWLAVDQWIKLRNSIKEKPIIQLNAEQITKDLQTIYQSLHKSTKNFRNGPTSVLQIATELKQECNEMKDHIPLLTALLNPGMKQRHWQKLSEEIGFEFALDDEITLNDALELKLEDKIDVVSEVVGVASKEYSIETALQKMYSEWEEVVLDISPYKDTGTYVLKGSDDIIQKLDDDMVMTNTMEFSPYKKPFEERLNRWEATLKLITYVIEEWLECQRSWLALEPIFSSPDIRKQLPTESERFSTVDKTWRKILDNANRTPQALKFCPSDKLLEDFKHNNKLLGHVQRGLNDYLESKRVAFPRFYFLSNDELLSILSQTKDPTAVQRHLRRCFENIGSLTFEKDLKMTEMNSCENEKVPFVRGIYPEGNVENWLLEVEADMRETLRDIMKKAVEQYPKVPRTEWVLNWPSQVVLAGAMIYWTKHVEEAIKRHAVKELLDALNVQMIELTKLVRVTTDFLNLRTLSCLIVLDVHAHDVVEKLVEVGVDSIDAFEWMSQLRYYWENDTVLIRMMTYEVEYGYEYLGNTSRLVITPLTDRCYLTLTSALQMNMGGAPQGPAGTGKTETTKDLAKAVAFQCVVYNCSETVDYLQMGVFLTGLASCGAWACFDEFNRIYVEVLSVIAQQITTIQNAIQANLKVFRFENRDVKLSPRCAVFITMNPGYAGRTELPDNLKALFRPVAMMVPDYRMIAEIKLYSFGFTEARPLSEKIVATFRLSSEQLSAQRHYDFGMRAVNTVIQTAGNLRRLQPDMPEALIVLRAIKDVNVPKFLVNDLVLFNDIISDLFPGVKERTLDYTALIDAIKTCAKKMKLQVNDLFITKIRQLHETFAVRWGVMLVGPTGAGKTQVFKTLAAACTLLNQTNQTFKKTHYHILNPKSITMGQLFGEFDMTTHEWTNGVLSEIIKQCSEDETPDNQWIVLDGPVDALWIENMNTVLDDNKKLCLSSSAVINFTDRMMMLFEVEDLAVASPATVSRCGMVFMQPNPDMKYLLESWIENQHPGIQKALMEILSPLYDKYLVPALKFVRERLKEPIKTTNSNLIQSLLRLFHALIQPFYSPDPVDPVKDDQLANISKWAPHFFWFAMIWSLGCTTDTDGRIMFDGFVRQQLRTTDIQFPSEGLVYDYKFNTTNDTWENWMAGQPAYHISPGTSFNEIVVPTIDNVRHTFLIQTLLTAGYNFFCTGPTGTAKSVTINRYMMSSLSPETFMPIFISFSAQTNANQTQDIIDAKFERRLKGVYGPLDRKRAIIFFDDVNMPAKEVYGAQPPIELLRQWLDHGGWYDRKALEFHKLVDSQMICACGHPGGGRQHLTARFTRQFNLFNFPELQDESLQMIFKTMLDSYLTIFDRSIQAVAISIADATISIYNTVRRTMLPIPSKSHYTFNLRDVSKVIQGVMSLHKAHIDTDRDIIAVWAHECTRVFADRLVDKLDLDAFSELLNKELQGRFKVSMDDLKKTKNLLYCDFFEETNEQKPYVQVTDEKKLETILNNAMADYDEIATKKLGLVLFPDAIEHVIRISRIIRQPSGHALLLGVGGSGRQSLTRLACHLSEYTIIQPEITKTYGTNEWLADIRTVMKSAGYEEKPTVFLVSDAQIVKESFLEDLNNLLNSGDVPNIFPPEDIEEIIEKIRPIAQQKDIQLSKPSIYNLFIQRVKSSLHIVIALSPIGEAFRRRLRMFPSLVTCTSIDWFSDWSKDALFSVAQEFFADTFPNEKLQEVCSNFCVTAHTSVVEMSKELFQHEKRHNYVTPTSFLDFVQLVNRIQTEKMKEISKIKQSMETGLSALQVANSSVKDLQEKIIALQPTLDQLIKDADASKVEIAAEEEKTNEVRAKVEAETKVAEAKKAETQELKDAAEKDLAEIMPVLEKAQEGVKGLSSKAISTVRSYTNPPPAVRDVMKGVCILLRQHVITEPGKLPGEVVENWWGTSQKVLADPRFRNRLEKFTEEEKDNIPDSVIQKLLPLYKSENWSPEKAGACGEATLSLFNWVVAMGQYHDARKAVLPKEEALKQAQAQLDVAQKALDESLAKLKAAEDKIAKLRDDFQQVVSKKDDLLQQQEECKSKLSRAETLINNLSGEKGRWEATLNSVIEQEKNLTGDVLVAAAGVAYSGPFPSEYRARLLRTWIDFLSKNNITTSPGSSIIQTLQDPVEVLKWNLSGLPRDNMSLENTIIMSKSRRYSLCIDPQGQANRFIRNLNKDNQMEIVKLTDDNLVRSIENSIRFGRPLLIENVPEELDPILDPVLQNQVYKQSGADVIKIGDTVIPYNRGFRLYITTQLPNPHFSPELSAKVCLLDFTCTPSGLEEQLLALVVAKERPELEEMKNNLVIQNSKNQKKLLEIRAKMLDCLEKTEPSKLLDDIEIITTLTESNTMSQTIQQQVKEAEETERTIDTSRQTYRQVAFRGSLLFFCISTLFYVDPMYQYSLAWYISFFSLCIDQTPASDVLETRLSLLIDTSTKNFYNNICRSLFERHKRMFAFLLCYRIMQGANEIDSRELRFLIAGPIRQIEEGENPAPKWLTSKSWYEVKSLDTLPNFKGFRESFVQDIDIWKSIFDSPDASRCKFPGEWEVKLTLFQRLLVLRVLRPDSMGNAIQDLIQKRLGDAFLESPQFDISSSFDDSTVTAPLIFVLSVGADPASDLVKFAEKKNFSKKLSSMSLGQGQGEYAEQRLTEAMDRGHWLLLQNCHLAVSWLPRLEILIERIKPEEVNRDFRLWLTSMPSADFPVSILQRGIKMTNEPPKGIKQNLLRSMMQYDDKTLNDCAKPFEYHKLIYSLCFFHALTLERRKYGPLGFNQIYDWTTGDLEISQKQLKMFLDLYDQVPYKVLTYLTGEINYGGRVTDDWDRRTLLSILGDFYNPDVMSDTYKFTENPRYVSLPEQSHKMYIASIREYPINDSPDIFGLHANAEVSYQQSETFTMFNNLLLLQARTGGGGSGQTREEVINGLATDLLREVPDVFDMPAIQQKYPIKYEDSMNTVLVQQCEMYNKLITICKTSLRDIINALKGIVVMSGELEAMGDSMFDNHVPVMWSDQGYPSTKPLSGWMQDLKKRVKFLQDWVERGPPTVFWISGFFMQQAFLTGIKQNCARKNQIGVDTISFGFEVMDTENPPPRKDEGVYITGLFIEGASWDPVKKVLADPRPKELFQAMPPIVLKPIGNRKKPTTGIYECPVYKVGTRKGTLSTTGHSTNYVLTIELPSDKPQSFWIKRGVAMICSLSY